jgi:hypothetical protein
MTELTVQEGTAVAADLDGRKDQWGRFDYEEKQRI